MDLWYHMAPPSLSKVRWFKSLIRLSIMKSDILEEFGNSLTEVQRCGASRTTSERFRHSTLLFPCLITSETLLCFCLRELLGRSRLDLRSVSVLQSLVNRNSLTISVPANKLSVTERVDDMLNCISKPGN